MTPLKRALDLILAIPMAIIALPFIALIAAILLLREGRPVFYLSERMKTPIQSFQLYKFRTMRNAAPGANTGVTGGDKSDRVSPLHARLRRSRLDELPQLLNVIRGDMSFVGPRPPLKIYVDDYPEIYREVLACRPGITGLASLAFHAHEEKLLRACASAEETDEIYRRRCIPRKARLDLMYRENRSICFDIQLMAQTVGRVLLPTKRAGLRESSEKVTLAQNDDIESS